MRKLFSILLTFALLASCAAALAEEESIHLGYIVPMDAEGGRYSLCADAFNYAFTHIAEPEGAALTILRYDPQDGEIPEDAESEDRIDPAVAALMSLIEDGVDGVVLCPTSIEQAEMAIELAQEAGVPIVIEGLDVSPAYLPEAEETPSSEETSDSEEISAPEETPDPAEARPYLAAIGYGDAAAYTAAMWLEEFADNPLMFHCALPEYDPAIQAGLARALSDSRYLILEDDINAEENTVAAGSYAVDLFTASGAFFDCVFADNEILAEGCSQAVRSMGESCPIAAISCSPAGLELLQSGKIDMLAAAPVSVEGVETFKLIWDFITEGILPETETGFVQLPVITVTKSNTASWIGNDDFEAAYAQAYPEVETT